MWLHCSATSWIDHLLAILFWFCRIYHQKNWIETKTHLAKFVALSTFCLLIPYILHSTWPDTWHVVQCCRARLDNLKCVIFQLLSIGCLQHDASAIFRDGSNIASIASMNYRNSNEYMITAMSQYVAMTLVHHWLMSITLTLEPLQHLFKHCFITN